MHYESANEVENEITKNGFKDMDVENEYDQRLLFYTSTRGKRIVPPQAKEQLMQSIETILAYLLCVAIDKVGSH